MAELARERLAGRARVEVADWNSRWTWWLRPASTW